MKAARACSAHSGLRRTEAQQRASRENPSLRFCEMGLRDDAERGLVADYLSGKLTPADILEKIEVTTLLRLHRAALAEESGLLDPLVRGVLQDARTHLVPETADQPRPMEEWEFVQKVEDAIAKRPEALLARLLKDFPPEKAQQVRELLRKPAEACDAPA